MIDYRKILKFYINHVGECEGTTFLGAQSSYSELTPEENAALDEANEEARQEWIARQI